MFSIKKIHLLTCIIVCQLQANNWELKQKLTSNGIPQEAVSFGSSAKLSGNGNTLIVGAPDYNHSSGATWIFQKQADGWKKQTEKMIIQDADSGAQGWNVAISDDGTRIAIGSFYGNTYAKAWIFERTIKNNDPEWIQLGQPLLANNTDFPEGIDLALALSGNGKIVAMGNPADSNTKGYTIMYEFDGTQWNSGPKIIGSDINNATYQGSSVALSYDGSILAVGAPGDENSKGGVFVFKCSGTTCTQEGKKLIGSDTEKNWQQGSSVALSHDGKTLAFCSGPAKYGSNGSVWVFIYSGQWIQQGKKLFGHGITDDSQLGSSVALSGDGNILLIGDYTDNRYTGAAWKFIRTKDALWIQDGEKMVAANTVEQGYTVALSGDGNIAAIGSPHDADYLGAVLIYGPTDLSSSRETYMTYWLPPLLAIAAGIITFGLKYIIKKHCCKTTDDSALPTHIKLSDPLVMIETHRGSFA